MEVLTLHLRGGQSPQYRAEKFTLMTGGSGTITSIKWDGVCEPEPMYFDPEAIDVVDIGTEPDA
jgi:hypothetical protein